jgi:Flp pilus assembly protein CpaB
MSRRTVVLVTALVLAVVAAFAVWRYLSSVEDQVRGDLEEVVVYRATEPIPAGTAGAEAADSIEQAPALVRDVVFPGSTILCTGPVDPDSAADPSACDDNPNDLNELLASGAAAGPISAGQMITEEMFVAADALDPNRLATDVPEGKMAAAMTPEEVGALGNFVAPGDRVNVLATLTFNVESLKQMLADPATRELLLQGAVLPDFLTAAQTTETTTETGETITEVSDDALARLAGALPDSVTITRTVLQNIPVLAVGQASVSNPQGVIGEVTEDGQPAAAGDTSVVLEVLPTEAELLEFARRNGMLGLTMLPADGEYTELELPGATMDDVARFAERLITALEEADAG